eukprot:TRINITY_DN10637_c0_g1_i1.p1 TRINITY_DN10637_c0_g1~~TRINITY_DN10637_c0_g1_i1.p1  ORF type:complete len:778 (+),score=181.27 TRINITY_DN10637_c0_g1_i1:228-2561(+)
MASIQNISNTDAAFGASVFSIFLEIISPLATELAMFSLAVIVYTLFSGQTVLPLSKLLSLLHRRPAAPKRKLSPSYEEACSKAVVVEEKKAPEAQPKADEVPADCQNVLQAARAGNIEAMLDAMQSGKAPEMPLQVVVKVLLAIAKAKHIEEDLMWKLMDLSTEQGLCIDQQAFETAAAEAARWRSPPACRKLYDIAGLLSIPKTDRALSYLMRGHSKDAAAMLTFTEDITAEGSGITVTKALSEHLLAQCTSGVHDSVVALIKERRICNGRQVKAASPQSPEVMIKGLILKDDIPAARRLLRDMSTSNMPASTLRHSYNQLLQEFVKRGEQEAAWQLVDEMKSTTSCDLGTCSVLMKGIHQKSRHPEFSRMLAFFDSSFQHLSDEDELRRQSMIPVVVGYLIKDSGHRGDMKKVWEAWNHMNQRKVKCTSVTLGCMVEALVSNRQSNQAWTLVNQMWEDPENHSLVNTVIYSTIVKGFAIAKQHERVLAVCKEMKDRGIHCNTITYNTMLNCLARCGTMEHVDGILVDMRSADPPALPDLVTYSTIVKGYSAAGELEKALQVYQDVKKAGLVPDEVMYNSLLDGCARSHKHKMEEALNILEEMQSSGIAPSNYTLSIIVKIIGRAGAAKLDMAFQLVDALTKKYGFKANIQVHTCLMQACFLNRQPVRALTLHDAIVKGGVSMPDERTYTAMARGCMSNGLPEKAVEVIRCAYHLPRHSMEITKGSPPGVDGAFLEDFLKGKSSRGCSESTLKALASDLKGPAAVPTPQARRHPWR